MKEILDRNGFAIIPKLVATKEVRKCLEQIKSSIDEAAGELKVTTEDYLNCTGRWSTLSPITIQASKILNQKIQNYIEKNLAANILLKKSNIICKTADITDSIPFHQDISYNPKDPYHFSIWLSFNDVDNNCAPIKIIKNSHHNKIEPAVDFWHPFFQDVIVADKKNLKTLTVQAGDAIIFNSRLWHGSDTNYSKKDRFAYVTRWLIKDESFPDIPEIQPKQFGMFNCGDITEEILTRSLVLFDHKLEYRYKNREKTINHWIDILENGAKIEGVSNTIAIKDLRKLNILNKASEIHAAGNISGLVYKNLWFSLLFPLNSKIQLLKINTNEN